MRAWLLDNKGILRVSRMHLCITCTPCACGIHAGSNVATQMRRKLICKRASLIRLRSVHLKLALQILYNAFITRTTFVWSIFNYVPWDGHLSLKGNSETLPLKSHTHGGWPLWVLQVFRLSWPVEGCREERPQPKGRQVCFVGSLKVCTPTLRANMKMERATAVCVVTVSCSICEANVSSTHLCVQGRLSYGALTPHSSR